MVCKGILLYTTFILSMLYIGGVDSIYDQGYFIPATIVVATLIYVCYKTISEQELDTLLLTKVFGKYNEEDDEW